MAKYRKKPIVVEALQFTGSNRFEAIHFMGERYENTDFPYIHTLEGVLSISPGDWIIKGVKGEYYPCKPDIFAEIYEAGEEQ